MKENLETEVSVNIDANASEVWKALTTPAVIREYLMGTKVTTDWKEGSPITYEGEYKGKSYKDKGVIKKVEPNR
ncbi:MAG TPA: SRPBCC domain-containing protein, partial [Puia sp.]|nr:SRPBCC domain-containing protein [Puia sp.]